MIDRIKRFKELFKTHYNQIKENPKAYIKAQLFSLSMLTKAAVIFALKAMLKTVAFLVAVVLFIEAFQLVLSGAPLMAALFFIPAVVALRYSWLPFKIISTVLSIIATPVTYVGKRIFLAIVDHLIDEFGIAQHAKNRPLKQFFEVDDDTVDVENPNPSLEFRTGIDTDSYQFGIFTISPGAVFRYMLPQNISYTAIKKSVKKLLNFLIYESGLSSRAQYIANFPENEAKRLQALQTSESSQKDFVEKISIQANVNNISLEGALDLIIANNADLAKYKLQDGKNWLHYLQKINVPQHLKYKYVGAVVKIIGSGVSPYERDTAGVTAFGVVNSENENNSLLRVAINGKYPDLIGLEQQVHQVEKFINNVKNGAADAASADRRLLVLDGPPGLGKTETIINVMKKENIRVLTYKKADQSDGIVGGHVNRILALFKLAKESGTPVCIFIDELDSILHSNEKDANSQHDRGPINAFQEEITKLKGTQCFVIGATNHFEDLKEPIKSRAGSPIYFRHPNTETINRMLQDKLKNYCIKDGAEIIAKIAENFYGMSPRDLNAFVYAVADNHEDNKTIITIEDFKNAIKRINATTSKDVPGLKVVFKNIDPPKLIEDFELLTLEKDVLEQITTLKNFFDTRFINARVNFENNLKRVLFRGFSAKKFINTITNNSVGPTLYFDAAKIDDIKTFLPKLSEKIRSYEKCLLVIDNIDFLKKGDLEKLSNENGLLFIIGATEKSALKEGSDLLLDMWDENIEVKASIPNEKERSDIIIAGLLDMHNNDAPIPESLPSCAGALAKLCDSRTNKQELRELLEQSQRDFFNDDKKPGKPMLTYAKMEETILKSKHKKTDLKSKHKKTEETKGVKRVENSRLVREFNRMN